MENIELDCCNNCGGIWFDAHELKQIINQHGTQPMGLAEAFFKFIHGHLEEVVGPVDFEIPKTIIKYCHSTEPQASEGLSKSTVGVNLTETSRTWIPALVYAWLE